jgi:uncharacterized coiled-coil protein SlyX
MEITQRLDDLEKRQCKHQSYLQSLDKSITALCADVAKLKMQLAGYEHLNPLNYEHPDCWTPVTVPVSAIKETFAIHAWLRETAPGRYDVCNNWVGITVFFEQRADAVAFKLRWAGAQ